MSRRPRAPFLYAAVSIASIAATLWVLFVFLAPSRPSSVRVSYPDFSTDLESGRIQTITIHDEVYTYRVGGATKQTVGPVLDVAQVRKLRPSNPELSPPRVQFEL